MNTKMLSLLAVVVLPLLGGCVQANSAVEEQSAPPPPAVTNAALPLATNAPAAVPIGQVVNAAPVIPDTLKLTPAAAEIAKLAQSGLAPGVMIAYVTNSVNTFNLSADEIVYLNDLGLAPEVMTAMIQHDQRIREASLQGAVAASPATPSAAWSVTLPPQSNVWQQPVTEPAPVAEAEGVTTAPPPPPEELPAPATVNHFYDSLSPYGTWIDIDGYGRCWRPTVMVTNPGWRPYVNGGRWVWTDSGWYWYSDYSWGWAPFHYGRWFSHPGWGWCWMPGSVWGPSWVSWSFTDSHCGWAPLPPAACFRPRIGFTYFGSSCRSGFSFGISSGWFTYVSFNNFCNRNFTRVCVPRHEVPRIHNSGTIVNNYINGNNNTIINQGIGTDRITRATRSEIPQATVREIGTTAGGPRGPHTGRNEMLAADGRTLQVTRTDVPGAPAAGPTRTGRAQSESSVTPTPASTVSSLAPTMPSRHETGRNPLAAPRNQSTTSVAPVRESPAMAASVAPSSSPTVSAAAPIVSTEAPRNFRQPPERNPVRTTTEAAPATAASPAGNTDSASAAIVAPRSGNSRPASTVIIRSSRNIPLGQVMPPTPAAQAPLANNNATPWLNNTPAAPSASASAAATSRQLTIRSSRNEVTPRNSYNSSSVRQSSAPIAPPPAAVYAPTPASVTPRVYQTPAAPRIERSAPVRTFGAPAPPQLAQTPSPRNFSAPQTYRQPAPVAPAMSAPVPAPRASETRSAPTRSSTETTPSAPTSRGESTPRGNSGNSNARGNR